MATDFLLRNFRRAADEDKETPLAEPLPQDEAALPPKQPSVPPQRRLEWPQQPQRPSRLADLKRAQSADSQDRAWGDVSDALQSAFSRTAVRPASAPQRAGNLLQQEMLADNDAAQGAAAEDRQLARAERLSKSQQAAALADPTSAQSQRVRAIAETTTMGKLMKQQLGAQWETTPGSSIPGHIELLKLEPKQGAGRTPAQQRLDEANAQLAEAKVGNIGKGAKTVEAWLSQYGRDISPETAALLKDADPDTAAEMIKVIEAKNRAYVMAAAGRAKAADEKATGKALVAIPGYESDPGVMVKPDEAVKLRRVTAQQKSIEETLSQIEGLYNQFGRAKLPGPQKAQLTALLNDLRLNLKNESQYQLGVLSGNDEAILKSITGNPTGLGESILDYFTDGETTAAQLRTVRDRTRSRARALLEQSGYRPVGARGAAPGPSGGGTVLVSNGTETREIAQEDLADFMENPQGFKVVRRGQ